jgi:hypothetical protein
MQIVDNFFVKRRFWGKNRQKLTEKREENGQNWNETGKKFALKIIFLWQRHKNKKNPPKKRKRKPRESGAFD